MLGNNIRKNNGTINFNQLYDYQVDSVSILGIIRLDNNRVSKNPDFGYVNPTTNQVKLLIETLKEISNEHFSPVDIQESIKNENTTNF